MTQMETLEMIERRRAERRKKKFIKKKIKKLFFHFIAVIAVEAAMIASILYCIDNMTVYR